MPIDKTELDRLHNNGIMFMQAITGIAQILAKKQPNIPAEVQLREAIIISYVMTMRTTQRIIEDTASALRQGYKALPKHREEAVKLQVRLEVNQYYGLHDNVEGN